MAETRAVNPWTWQDQLGFSQAIEIQGGHQVVYCAGQTSVDGSGNPIYARDMAKQINQALDNLEIVLKDAGLTLANVVRLNYYTTDMTALFKAAPAYGPRLAAAGCKPAASALGVTSLFHPELMIEIEATAVGLGRMLWPGGNAISEQDNVRTVQMIYNAFGRGDVATILDTLADGFEWHHRGAPAVPWGKSRSTKEEVESFFRELDKAVEVLALEVLHYVTQGDKVVVLGTFKARAKKTGKEFEDPWAMVWTLKDGKVVGYRAYEDTAAIASAFC